jgi:cytochrome P450
MRTVDFEGGPAGAPPHRLGWRNGVPVYRARGALGNARIMRHDPVDLLTSAHEAGGDTVLIPIAPGLRVYSFRHPDAVRDIVMDPERVLIKGRTYSWLRRDVGLALLVSDGPEHAWRRAAMQPLFTRPAVANYEDVMSRSIAETAGRWSALAPGARVDVQEELSELALRIIGEIMFGNDFTAEAGYLQQMFAESTEALGELLGTASQALPRWVPTPINRRLEHLRREIEPALSEIIERRMAAREPQPDLLGQMTCPVAGRHTGAAPRAYATSKEVLDEVKGVVGAGHETTANLLTWILYFLAVHPDIQAKLAAQIDERVGDRPTTLADLDRLPYNRAVVQETLRLMPPSWAILRETTRETVIGGVPVPARAFVVCCPYVTQRDPRWYPEPLRFLPERAETHPPAPPFAFFPFGRGPKFCLGKTLAELETELVVAELTRGFRFRADAGRFVEPLTRVAVKPVGGLRLAVEPRRPGAPATPDTAPELAASAQPGGPA